MKRLVLISTGILAAGGIAVAPAIAGLTDNPSFSHQIPIRVPSQAHEPRLGDDSGSATRHVEPRDDRGGATRLAEPGDDSRGRPTSSERGDDNGRHGGHGDG